MSDHLVVTLEGAETPCGMSLSKLEQGSRWRTWVHGREMAAVRSSLQTDRPGGRRACHHRVCHPGDLVACETGRGSYWGAPWAQGTSWVGSAREDDPGTYRREISTFACSEPLLGCPAWGRWEQC